MGRGLVQCTKSIASKPELGTGGRVWWAGVWCAGEAGCWRLRFRGIVMEINNYKAEKKEVEHQPKPCAVGT